MAKIPFTDNYADLSSNRGFQFKFHCQNCGNGYLSTFQTNALSTVATAAQVVSTLFGGFLGRASAQAQAAKAQAIGKAGEVDDLGQRDQTQRAPGGHDVRLLPGKQCSASGALGQ
jgi:hypothetical protein